MNDKIKKIDEILFFTAYIIWMTIGLLNVTYFSEILPLSVLSDYANQLVFILTVIQFAVDRPVNRRELSGVLFLVVVWIVCLIGERTFLFYVFCLVYSARKVDLKKIFMATLVLDLAILLCTIAAAYGGLIENEQWSRGASGIMRGAMGFKYPAYPSQILFFATLLYMILRKKIHLIEAVLLGGLNYGMYYMTNTRTEILLLIPIIVAALIWCRKEGPVRDNFFSKICVKYLFIFAFVVSMLAQYFYTYTNPVFLKMDSVLGHRLVLGNNAIQTYGISPFGKYVTWVGMTTAKNNPDSVYNFVDNSFLKMTINYGLLFMIILSVIFCMMAGWAMQNGNRALCLAIIAAIGYSVINAGLDNLYYNTILIALSRVFLMEEDGGYHRTWRYPLPFMKKRSEDMV